MSSVYDFTARDIDGNPRSLAEWRGKALLIVNTASKCGFTPQYRGPGDAVRGVRATQGLVVLGFPCNQFGHQEPGRRRRDRELLPAELRREFPMFAKIDVNGDDAHPLYQWLKTRSAGVLGSEAIKWNFTKFLVGRDGQVVKRYAPTDTPEKIGKDNSRPGSPPECCSATAAEGRQHHGDRVHVVAGPRRLRRRQVVVEHDRERQVLAGRRRT